MKIKTVIILLLLSILFMCGCEGGETVKSDGTSNNEEYRSFRKAFLASDLYTQAYEYIENAVSETAPGCIYEISLEPGSIRDLAPYENFADDDTVKTAFFKAAHVSLLIEFWDSNTDGEVIAKYIAEKGISCEMLGDEFASGFYIINGETKTVKYEIQPEV